MWKMPHSVWRWAPHPELDQRDLLRRYREARAAGCGWQRLCVRRPGCGKFSSRESCCFIARLMVDARGSGPELCLEDDRLPSSRNGLHLVHHLGTTVEYVFRLPLHSSNCPLYNTMLTPVSNSPADRPRPTPPLARPTQSRQAAHRHLSGSFGRVGKYRRLPAQA